MATKGVTSLVLSFTSSVAAQLMAGKPVGGDMAVDALNFGISKTPPYSHFW